MKTLKIILINLSIWVFTYLSVSFVLADFNAMQWSQEERGGYIFAAICFTVLFWPLREAIKLIEK